MLLLLLLLISFYRERVVHTRRRARCNCCVCLCTERKMYYCVPSLARARHRKMLSKMFQQSRLTFGQRLKKPWEFKEWRTTASSFTVFPYFSHSVHHRRLCLPIARNTTPISAETHRILCVIRSVVIEQGGKHAQFHSQSISSSHKQ